MRSTGRHIAGRLSAERLVLMALVLWLLVPLVVLFAGHRGSFNGAYGIQVDDQLQYLAFVRESGEHVLISDRFDIRPDPHVLLHPVSLVSGGLWRLGVSLPLAFLAWQPVAMLILFAGFAAYSRRILQEHGRAAVAAGLALALFFFTPAAALAEWLHGSPTLRFGTLLMGLETFPAGYPWSGAAGTIAIGLVPLFLLGVERVLEPARRAPRRSARWYAAWTGGAGLLVSWLHPWQGLTLLAIVAGLVGWGRFERRYLALLVPVALTGLPLVYFAVLTRTDSAWGRFSHPNHFAHLGWWFFLGLAPGLVALAGLHGRGPRDIGERLLRLSPLAVLLVYFSLHTSWFYQTLGGLSLPLALLAVRGWHRLSLPRWAAVAASLAVTLPGMVFLVSQLAKSRGEHFFAPDEKRALDYLDAAPRPGGVLAPQRLGRAVPAFAGRQTWVGNYQWTPEYDSRRLRAEALFTGRLPAREVRSTVAASGASFLLAGCPSRADLTRDLGALLVSVRRFGCSTVYEVRGRDFHAHNTAASSPGT